MSVIILSAVVFLLLVYIVVNRPTKSSNTLILTKPKSSIGSKGIYNTSVYVTQNSKKEEFYITYEVEVIAESSDKFKLKVLDYTSTASRAKEQNYRSTIIDIVDNTWIYKTSFDPITNTQADPRDQKINEILTK